MLPWGERNLGITRGTLEHMAAMHEAAVPRDALQEGGEYDVGPGCFARNAAGLGQRNTKLSYDFAAFVNPFRRPNQVRRKLP